MAKKRYKPTVAVKMRSELLHLREQVERLKDENRELRNRRAAMCNAVHELMNQASDYETGEECPF